MLNKSWHATIAVLWRCIVIVVVVLNALAVVSCTRERLARAQRSVFSNSMTREIEQLRERWICSRIKLPWTGCYGSEVNVLVVQLNLLLPTCIPIHGTMVCVSVC
uniref:Putative secreted peptide n=1 Tax=Anopheles braziliensis TaxID=58242 RepID=A0A2M3ZSG3_9DIPT